MAQPDPLKEAADPATDPERLRQLARHQDLDVKRTAMRNPSLPEFLWRQAFLDGWPEAWANPMAPLYVLAWTSESDEEDKDDEITISARWATQELWKVPERCSSEGKVLLNAKVQEWWAIAESAGLMIFHLGWWAFSKGKYEGSPEHREVVRILVLCVRTAINLTDKDHQVLDLLEAWSAGGEDRREEAESLTEGEQAPASLVAGGGPPPLGHLMSPHTASRLATLQIGATLSPAEGWTTSDGRSLKTGFIGLSEEVSDVKEPTFVQEASPPSGGSGPPALIAVVRHEEPSSSSRNVQGWGTAFGEGRVVGSPLNREAPSSPVRAGGGVVTSSLSWPVKTACRFAQDPSNRPGDAIQEVLGPVGRIAGKQAQADHDRLLVDLIRRARPLPPVVA